MANIVVCVPLEGGLPTPATLSVLGDARRVANIMGATVYALVVTGGAPQLDDRALGEAVGRVGADKVLLVGEAVGTDPGSAAAWQAALERVIERFDPRLFLLPVGGIGALLGPWLAGRTRSFLAAQAHLDIRAGSDAVPASVALRPGDQGQGPKDAVDLGAAVVAVVATLDEHVPPHLPDARPAEVVGLAAAATSANPVKSA